MLFDHCIVTSVINYFCVNSYVNMLIHQTSVYACIQKNIFSCSSIFDQYSMSVYTYVSIHATKYILWAYRTCTHMYVYTCIICLHV